LHQADQTPVSGLADLSAGRNDAVQNGNPPVYNGPASPLALNGKGTIHFTSADSITNATGLKTRANLGIAGDAPRSAFVVMQHDPGKVMGISIGDYAARFGYFGLEEDNPSLYLPRVYNRYANRVYLRYSGWNILEVICDESSQNAYFNGALKATNNFHLATVDKPVEIGLRTASANGKNAAAADGDFAELLIYDRALDGDERQQVENYLKAKWLGNTFLASHASLVWCDPKMPGITGFVYSRATGTFLLQKTENKRDSLCLFDPQTSKISLIAKADSIRNAQWLGTNTCAWIGFDSGTNRILLTSTTGKGTSSLSLPGNTDWFQALSGSQFLLTGMFSNEPAMGIWQYDNEARQLHPVVAGSDHPSVYAKALEPLNGTIAIPSGRKVNYTMFPPANFDRHKKYPLVIGDTIFGVALNGDHGRLWVPNMATCGAFVVIVDRAGWFKGIEQWGENVLGVTQKLAQNPAIDTGRIYLFGASAETTYMCEVMTNSADLWKGAIFLNPTGLPDFSQVPDHWLVQARTKILISAGAEEGQEQFFKKYQTEALCSGVIVEYVIHAGENHHLIGNAAQFERSKAIMHFIFEE